MTTTVQPSQTARLVAVKALNQWDRSQNPPKKSAKSAPIYAGQILAQLIDLTTQRQRATDLTFGTLRNRTAIDIVLAIIAETPPKRIARQLINVVRIGIYELIYQPNTPDYSIINEAVENAKTLAGQKQAGFVNAVLRKVAAGIVERCVELTNAEPRKTLPQNVSTGCEFAKCLLADPEAAPAEYLTSAFSLPGWLVNSWLNEFGPEQTRNICIASNRRPSLYIRPNTLKITTYKLAESFAAAEIDYDITSDDSMIHLVSSCNVTTLPGFNDGLFTIQDITAAAALKNLQLPAGALILDLCAAPGTKTTQLAEITAGKARIIATDIDGSRLKKLRQNIKRLGCNCIEVIPYDSPNDRLVKLGPADFVLLDVPCSNTGVLAKRPEVRHRLKPSAVDRLAQIQRQLINSAVSLIKPAGRICYTTCSILANENQKVVSDFLADNSDFTLESEYLTLPSHSRADHDGGYYAIIKKV